ncbi:hypothetical protein [Cochleicola gelatinilyticus]|uniref:hypothetical protein n=1 Tax=Cochleicola gelatinilyticus TaxID=1763537 RepID=UPI0008388E5C|nr:hypothetical protein [Cochleicola gelatinilyticus]
MTSDGKLTSEKPLTQLFHSLKIRHWKAAISHVQKLPYGRNSNRENISLVLTEQQGTCSSKHALLKQLADENNIPNVQLVLALYRMTEANTPGIAPILSQHALSHLPEAHCYLKIGGVVVDITSEETNFKKLQKDLISELLIAPYQVSAFKIDYHQSYLHTWLASEATHPYSFKELWAIRELCIQQLTRS